jgi:hypothetical protein
LLSYIYSYIPQAPFPQDADTVWNSNPGHKLHASSVPAYQLLQQASICYLNLPCALVVQQITCVQADQLPDLSNPTHPAARFTLANPQLTPLQLYRQLLRATRTLPESGQRTYYRHYIRQQFTSHTDETDANKINVMINRALDYAKWIQVGDLTAS